MPKSWAREGKNIEVHTLESTAYDDACDEFDEVHGHSFELSHFIVDEQELQTLKNEINVLVPGKTQENIQH